MAYRPIEYIARIRCCRCDGTVEAATGMARGLKTVATSMVDAEKWSRLTRGRLACPGCADRPDGDGWFSVDGDTQYAVQEVLGLEFVSATDGGLWVRERVPG
jgi:hypothetical protein